MYHSPYNFGVRQKDIRVNSHVVTRSNAAAGMIPDTLALRASRETDYNRRRLMRRLILNTMIMVVMLAGYSVAWGETIHVPGINMLTIEEALVIADGTEESDEIIIAAGTYEEHDLVLVSEVIISGETGNPADVIIDAVTEGRIFVSPVGSIHDITIRHLTISNGYLEEDKGAGICVKNGSNLLFDNLVFSNNHSLLAGGIGGGLYMFDSKLTLENCDFLSCSAWHGGGGVYSDLSELTVIGGSYTNNQSLTPS